MFTNAVLSILVTVFIKATNVSTVTVTVIFAQITIMHLLLCFSERARNVCSLLFKLWGDFGVHLQNFTLSVEAIDHYFKV